jgi:hypothetical protein
MQAVASCGGVVSGELKPFHEAEQVELKKLTVYVVDRGDYPAKNKLYVPRCGVQPSNFAIPECFYFYPLICNKCGLQLGVANFNDFCAFFWGE